MTDNLKSWPEKIYLDARGPDGNISKFSEGLNGVVDWYQEKFYENDIKYIRADIAKSRGDELLSALKEARSDIQSWAAYAGDYFQDKHGLKEALAVYDALINKFEVMK